MLAALAAARLFGAGTPLAQSPLGTADPQLLAGLLYLGSGTGLSLWRLLRRAEHVTLPADQRRWLAGAVLAGGVIAPLLLMFGLSRLPASAASLLLNAEGVFTALLAWFAFKENFDRPHRARHGSDRRRRRGVELAGRSTDRRTLARVGRAGRPV